MANRAVNIETVIGMVNTYFRNVLNLNPDLLIDGIVSLLTVDAVEVVRCKDCKYWKTGEGVNRSKKVKFCTYAIYHSYARRDEDFCSRGERKDGDND